MPSTNKKTPAKRAGFFCELPLSTIAKIKSRSSATKPQWQVIQEAVEGITVKKGVVKMIIMPAKKGGAKIAKKRSRK